VLWSDLALPAMVERLRPDLIVVVHGRRFAQQWGERFKSCNTAVWLLDEPYEVDDTERWSKCYRTVFVNDAATLGRHRNAHCLPVCFDDATHRDPMAERRYRVGFVGGANATRERYLETLASGGLLDYVVGGPWTSPLLRRLTLARKVTPAETTRLYQQTQIVINVFREVHHFNRQAMPATAPNPRVLEALACGALVVSERRTGVSEMFPELPQFGTPDELVELVSSFMHSSTHLQAIKQRCVERLQGHSYRDRLSTMLKVAISEAISEGTSADLTEVPLKSAGTEGVCGVRLPAGWRTSRRARR
jgi:spore maturation protein CgeB